MHGDMPMMSKNVDTHYNPITATFCLVILLFNIAVLSLMILHSYNEYQKAKSKNFLFQKEHACDRVITRSTKSFKSQPEDLSESKTCCNEEFDHDGELSQITKRNTERNKIVGTLYSNIPVFEIKTNRDRMPTSTNKPYSDDHTLEEMITCEECLKMNQTHEGEHSFSIPRTSEIKNPGIKGPKLRDTAMKVEFCQLETFELKQSEAILCRMHEKRLELMEAAKYIELCKSKFSSKKVRFTSS